MITEILISGSGGQGLMSLGKILAKAAFKEDKEVTFFPCYGAEVRGGTAHCCVKISDEPISSPLLDSPQIAIILNQPSLDKFGERLKRNGLLILNSDLIQRKLPLKGIKVRAYPLNRIALECGGAKTANMVALGVLISLRPQLLNRGIITEVLEEIFRDKDTGKQNLKAFYKGESIAKGGYQ